MSSIPRSFVVFVSLGLIGSALVAAGPTYQLARPGRSTAWQPGRLTPRLEGKDLGIGIESIRFVPADRLQGGQVDGQAGTLALANSGAQARWSARRGGGEVIYTLTRPAGTTQDVRITLFGAARAVWQQEGQLTLLRNLPPRPRGFQSRTLVVQNPQRQTGLLIRLVRPDGRSDRKAPTASLAAGPDGSALLRIHEPQAGTLEIHVRAFTGDALLALESATPAEAETNAPATRLASRAQPAGPDETAQAVGSESEPVAVGAPDTDADGPWWQLFPNKTRLMDPLLADQREASMRFGYLIDHGSSQEGDDTYFDVQLGTDLVVLYKKFDADNEMTLSGRALVSSRLQMGENSPLLNVDYVGGAALGYRHKADTFELFVYHQSSHLGDETLDFNRRARIDYSREAVRLLWSREVIENLRVYAGPTFNFSTADPDDLDNTFILQGGAEYRWDLGGWPMYAAVDVQAKEENDWRVNVNTQVGIEFGSKWRFFHRPRLFIEYFNGNSNMGQYWDEHESMFGIGFGFDL